VRVPGLSGFRRATTRETRGTASFSSSSRFPVSSADWLAKPVTFPPGLARLATRPFSSGSPQEPHTIGISRVAALAAKASAGAPTKMTSTLRLTNSLNTVLISSAVRKHLRSTVMFWPGICPKTRRPW
jgi:hypothetical protein